MLGHQISSQRSVEILRSAQNDRASARHGRATATHDSAAAADDKATATHDSADASQACRVTSVSSVLSVIQPPCASTGSRSHMIRLTCVAFAPVAVMRHL